MLLLGLLLLAGCAERTQAPEPPDAPVPTPADAEESAPQEGVRLRALIVDGAETGLLVLADESAAYLLDAGAVPVTLDGAPADASALEDGMTVELLCGDAPAALPAELSGVESISVWSLGTAQNPGGTAYDLCGLYLRVLDDLWEKDPGLNGGAAYVSVDLCAAPGELSDAAKSAVAWVFARRHGAQPLTLTTDELAAQGYLTVVNPETPERPLYEWKDGLLFRITADEAAGGQYSLPMVRFTADKWRSPLGAYGFARCTAVWPELGTWSGYSVEAEFIA